MTYSIRFTDPSWGYRWQDTFPTLESATSFAKLAHFHSVIEWDRVRGYEIIATHDALTGVQMLDGTYIK